MIAFARSHGVRGSVFAGLRPLRHRRLLVDHAQLELRDLRKIERRSRMVPVCFRVTERATLPVSSHRAGHLSAQSWWKAAGPLSGGDRVKADVGSGGGALAPDVFRWWIAASPLSVGSERKSPFVHAVGQGLGRLLVGERGTTASGGVSGESCPPFSRWLSTAKRQPPREGQRPDPERRWRESPSSAELRSIPMHLRRSPSRHRDQHLSWASRPRHHRGDCRRSMN